MKYELTDETKTTENGIVLHRICALRDIPRWSVSKGDIGGWVEKEANLSQYGDAWISENAMVYGDAKICGNAVVCGNAKVYGDAQVGGNARVSGDAQVRGNAWVCEKAWVYGNAKVSGIAQVYGNAEVSGYANVSGNAMVCGNAKVYGDAQVCEKAWVSEKAKVCGNAGVCGNAEVSGDAVVCSSADYSVFKNTWSSFRWFTYTRSNKMWKVGCFYGTGEDLIKKAYADSDKSGRCYEATVKYFEAIESATAKEGVAK